MEVMGEWVGIKAITKLVLDALQVGASMMHKLNQKRMESIRQDLHDSLRSICNEPEEEDVILFGENLNEKVKTINQAKSLGNKMSDYNSNSDKKSFWVKLYQPYEGGRGQSQKGRYQMNQGYQNENQQNLGGRRKRLEES